MSEKIKVGDQLYVVFENKFKENQYYIVEKVGRKYIYFKDCGYYIEKGFKSVYLGNFYAGTYWLSKEEYEADRQDTINRRDLAQLASSSSVSPAQVVAALEILRSKGVKK